MRSWGRLMNRYPLHEGQLLMILLMILSIIMSMLDYNLIVEAQRVYRICRKYYRKQVDY